MVENFNHAVKGIGTITEISYPEQTVDPIFTEFGITPTETRGHHAIAIIDSIISTISSGLQPDDECADDWVDTIVKINKNGKIGTVKMSDFISYAHKNYAKIAEALNR